MPASRKAAISLALATAILLLGVNLKLQSIIAFVLMIAGLGWLIWRKEVFAASWIAIAIQIAAALLMGGARVAFGMRSFHAAANPTAGGLVTSGPYRWIRHPIYAAVLYFTWATALDHRTWQALLAAVLVTLGAGARIHAEERLLMSVYPEYADYRGRTARVIPFLL